MLSFIRPKALTGFDDKAEIAACVYSALKPTFASRFLYIAFDLKPPALPHSSQIQRQTDELELALCFGSSSHAKLHKAQYFLDPAVGRFKAQGDPGINYFSRLEAWPKNRLAIVIPAAHKSDGNGHHAARQLDSLNFKAAC